VTIRHEELRMNVHPCPCCDGSGRHANGEACLFCAGDGHYTDATWHHYCPHGSASAAAPPRREPRRRPPPRPEPEPEPGPSELVEAYVARRNEFEATWSERDEALRKEREDLLRFFDSYFLALKELAEGPVAGLPAWEQPKVFDNGATIRSDAESLLIMTAGAARTLLRFLTDDAEAHRLPVPFLDDVDELTDGLGLTTEGG
jgi:hypothetical protein